MDLAIIQEAKQHVEDGNLPSLQQQISDLLANKSLPREPDWPFIFHKVYLHACLKGKHDIAKWLATSIFPLMDPIQQIALRQIFSYGRQLLSKADKLSEIKKQMRERGEL
jgi:hypothetical protein